MAIADLDDTILDLFMEHFLCALLSCYHSDVPQLSLKGQPKIMNKNEVPRNLSSVSTIGMAMCISNLDYNTWYYQG